MREKAIDTIGPDAPGRQAALDGFVEHLGNPGITGAHLGRAGLDTKLRQPLTCVGEGWAGSTQLGVERSHLPLSVGQHAERLAGGEANPSLT